MFFLFLQENICCGHSLEVPQLGTSNEYHNMCLCGDTGFFLLKNGRYLELWIASMVSSDSLNGQIVWVHSLILAFTVHLDTKHSFLHGFVPLFYRL